MPREVWVALGETGHRIASAPRRTSVLQTSGADPTTREAGSRRNPPGEQRRSEKLATVRHLPARGFANYIRGRLWNSEGSFSAPQPLQIFDLTLQDISGYQRFDTEVSKWNVFKVFFIDIH